MKKLLLLTLILCLVLPCLGCDTPDAPPAGDDSTNETTIEETTEDKFSIFFERFKEAKKQVIAECNPPRGEKAWEAGLGPGDYTIELTWSLVIPELDNAKIECSLIERSVYLNGERIAAGLCSRLYLSDLTGDGYPELCFTISRGEGIVDPYVLVYDYTTKSEVFELSDSMKHNYTLLLEDGFLLILERKYSKYDITDITRFGTFAYDGSKISVTWSDRTD